MAKDVQSQADAGASAEEKAPKKSKKGLLMGGGILSLIVAAYALSLMAVPKPAKALPFDGPFVITLSPGDVQVNLAADGSRRFLVISLQGEYNAYDQLYATERVKDTLYLAKLQDVLIRLGRKKSIDDLNDTVGEEVFKGEIRDAVDPLLFPVHIGNPMSATAPHEESGLRPGTSAKRSTLRGGFQSHALKVDPVAKTLQLDEGTPVAYTGQERDLEVSNQNNLHVYVDMTGLDPGFAGEVHVGTFGTIRQVLFSKFLVQ